MRYYAEENKTEKLEQVAVQISELACWVEMEIEELWK